MESGGKERVARDQREERELDQGVKRVGDHSVGEKRGRCGRRDVEGMMQIRDSERNDGERRGRREGSKK